MGRMPRVRLSTGQATSQGLGCPPHKLGTPPALALYLHWSLRVSSWNRTYATFCPLGSTRHASQSVGTNRVPCLSLPAPLPLPLPLPLPPSATLREVLLLVIKVKRTPSAGRAGDPTGFQGASPKVAGPSPHVTRLWPR